MLSGCMFKKIRKLQESGVTNYVDLAKKLGIDWRTAKKYVLSNTPPKYSMRKIRTKRDEFESFRPRVNELLKIDPPLFATEIFEIIKEEGFLGAERTVRRKVSEMRAQEDKERFFEQKYEPGEQSQFDFKERIELPFINGHRAIYLHFSTLPCSDYYFIRGYPSNNYECFIDGIHSFFEKIGGQTEKIRIDNLSPCVKKVLKGNDRIYTSKFNKAIEYYNFKILPCRPGKGSDKGDVEREIRTHAKKIQKIMNLKGIKIRDFDHLNQWLDEYVQKRLSARTIEIFKTEKSRLKILPPRSPEILFEINELIATAYGTVKLDKRNSYYSVPDSFIKSKVTVSLTPYEVIITRKADKTRICHPRKQDGENNILLEHVIKSLVRKPAAMIRWSHKEILFPGRTFKKFYDSLKGLNNVMAHQEYLRCLNLIQHTSLQEIELGMELLLKDKNKVSPSFNQLRELLLNERRPSNIIKLSEYINQRPISPKLDEYDDLIPGLKNEEGVKNESITTD